MIKNDNHDEFAYVGSELTLFSQAIHWKVYWSKLLRPYIGESVLEVGAGFGETTKYLISQRTKKLVCLEPDVELAGKIAEKIGTDLPPFCQSVAGTLKDIPTTSRFDTILYIDVIEHIENDQEELTRAASHLAPGGHLIILVPAHQSLYTPFDKAIGHFRRYDRKSLLKTVPKTVTKVFCHYLDSVGLLASLGNKLILNHSMPTAGQIRFWDSVLVPASRIFDPLTVFSLGKSVVGVWKKE
jgi:SAM-dependent methyltransferase